MRHDNARMMSDPAIRRMVKKSGRKGRKSEEEQKTMPTASETVEVLFRDSVEDGRYSVYVNPRGHRLLIVPDANGAVCCDNGKMRLPCIDVPLIGGETDTRRVAIVATGEGYEVSLD